ncbi:hypothetical protein ACJX0J_038417, partial [Zea mays]
TISEVQILDYTSFLDYLQNINHFFDLKTNSLFHMCQIFFSSSFLAQTRTDPNVNNIVIVVL